MIRRLAVHRGAGSNQRAVEGGDLDQAMGGIDADVHVAALVIDVERMGVELSLPTLRVEQLAVNEDHVVVEAVQRRPHALAAALPPAQRPGREQPCPGGPPDVVAQRFPIRRDLRAFQDRPLAGMRLQRDALVEGQSASAVDAATHDDCVAGDDALDRRFQRGGLFQSGAGGIGLSIGGDVVDVRGLRTLVALIDGTVGAAGWLRACRRDRGEKS